MEEPFFDLCRYFFSGRKKWKVTQSRSRGSNFYLSTKLKDKDFIGLGFKLGTTMKNEYKELDEDIKYKVRKINSIIDRV